MFALLRTTVKWTIAIQFCRTGEKENSHMLEWNKITMNLGVQADSICMILGKHLRESNHVPRGAEQPADSRTGL
jgi:hypothetical protein